MAYSFIKYDSSSLSTKSLQEIFQAYTTVMLEIRAELDDGTEGDDEWTALRKQYLQFRRAALKIRDELSGRSTPKKAAAAPEVKRKKKETLPDMPTIGKKVVVVEEEEEDIKPLRAPRAASRKKAARRTTRRRAA